MSLLFGHVENTLIRKIRIISKRNIREIIGEIFFFKNHAENEAGRLVSDPFLFFKKTLFKLTGLQISFNIFR